MKRKLLSILAVLICVPLTACGKQPETDQQVGDPVERFTRARTNTVSTTSYSYDFELSAKIKFKDAISFSPAKYSGSTYYNEGASETNFFQVRNITGALVIDSTNYIYNVGSDLIKISADEDKDFSVINHENVASTKDFDKNNFSCILKTLNDNDLLKVTSDGDKYRLSLKPNFSQDSLLGMLNYIDSQTILKALNSYTKDQWGINFNVNTWATLNSDNSQLKVFHFDASVVIRDVFEIGFEFEQTFTAYSGVSIQLPTFQNTITSQSEVTSELATLNTAYTAAKTAATSYYTFNVKTTVDHGVSRSNPIGLAVNSRTQGKAKRQIVGDKIYFNNRLEVDSDYKNNDQLGDLVKDYDSYRARINDGEDSVYDVLDPKVGFNQYTKLDGYDESSIDEFYMLPDQDMLSYDNVKVIKKTVDNNGNTTYKFGLSMDGVNKLITQYNQAIRIDFTRVTIFDIYKIKSDFVGKKALFSITLDSTNKIKGMKIDLKGFYVEDESDDQVKYRLQNEINFDWDKTYTAATTKEDIDN